MDLRHNKTHDNYQMNKLDYLEENNDNYRATKVEYINADYTYVRT